MPAYADTIGLRLIRQISEEGHTPLFTTREAFEHASRLGVSQGHLYKLLSEMAAAGWIRRLKGGLYVVPPAMGGPPDPHPFAVATRMAEPAAISHWSALHHWDLIDQVPLKVTASSPRSMVSPSARGRPARRQADVADRGHSTWVIDGLGYEFIRIPERDLFGIAQVWVDAATVVPMFDRERAVLDAFVHLKGFGAGRLGEQLVASAGDALDRGRLMTYAHQMGRPRVVDRVRQALDRGVLAPALAGPVWDLAPRQELQR